MEVRSIEYTITVDTGQSVRKINNLTRSLQGLQAASGGAASALNGGGSGGSGGAPSHNAGGGKESGTMTTVDGVKNLGNAAGRASGQLKNFQKPMQGLLGKLKRLAEYRMLRGIITGIASAFTEGVKNMYYWNKALGGEFAKAMDSLASSALTFKNSLAVASAPLLEWLAPIVATLAAQFADLATNVSRFFAILTGSDHYYEASTASVSAYGKAVGNATKKVRTLLKFDEINRLEERNKGSGSGSSGTYSGGGFKRVDLPKNLKDMTLLSRLQLALESWDFDFGGLFSSDSIITKFIMALGALKLAGLAFKKIGAGKILISFMAVQLGLTLASVIADAKGIKGTFGETVLKALGAVVGGLVASIVAGPVGIIIGVGTALALIINATSTEKGKADAKAWWADFKKKLIDNNIIGGPVFEWVNDKLKAIVSAIAETKVNEVTATETSGAKQSFWDGLKKLFGKGSTTNTTDVTVTDVNPTEASGVSKSVSLWLNNKYKHWTVPTYVDLEIKQVTVSGKKDVTLDVGGYRDKNGNVKNEIMLKGMASGGFLNQGDVFVAREAGPEMVGQIGNRTAVANNDQIVQGIASGVASANAQQNALLREQNALLRDILNKGTNITTGSISSAFERMNRREGSTVIAVGG